MRRFINGLLFFFLLIGPTALSQYIWPTYVFDTQFESGDQWDFTRVVRVGADSRVYVTNDVVHSGGYAWKSYFSTAAETREAKSCYTLSTSWNYDASKTNYVRFYFCMMPGCEIASGKYFNIFSWSYAGYSTLDEARVYNDSGTWKFRSSTLGLSSKVLTTNTWYCVESRCLAGSGDGLLTYWIDGEQVLDSSTFNNANAVTYLIWGQHGYMQSAWTDVSMDIRVDDIRVDYARIGTNDLAIRLHVPDLRARSGVPALVTMTSVSAGDKLVWSLASSTTTNLVLTNTAAKRVVGRVPLLGLAAGEWTLKASHQDSGGTELQSASYTWTKNYANQPRVSIDEYNRFLVTGTNFFPLGNFADEGDYSESCFNQGEINLMSGGDWNDRTTNGHKVVTDKMIALGCLSEVGFPLPNSPAPTTNDFVGWIEVFTNHAGMFSWFFEDEPELGAPYEVKAWQHRDWWQYFKLYDDRWPMAINFLGASFSQYDDFNGNAYGQTETGRSDSMGTHYTEGHEFTWPWLVADYYGNDTYPYSYQGTTSPGGFVMAIKRLTAWNLGLTPSLCFIQPYTLRYSSSTPGEVFIPPTTNQVQFMFWAAVASGASGARWFEYSIPRDTWTNNAQTNMAFVGMECRVLNAAITAQPRDDVTCPQECLGVQSAILLSNVPGVFFKSTVLNSTNYIFAVNLSKTVTNITFSSAIFNSGDTVGERYSGDEIVASAGSFEDYIPYEGYKVYSHTTNGGIPPAATGNRWQNVRLRGAIFR